jgi:hypothetical protein
MSFIPTVAETERETMRCSAPLIAERAVYIHSRAIIFFTYSQASKVLCSIIITLNYYFAGCFASENNERAAFIVINAAKSMSIIV